MLAVRTPGAPQATRKRLRDLRFRLPHCGTGSATPITIDFGAIFPFTDVPACNLPVYASQWPLPDTTQDSVRGCSLGFTAAAISGDRVQRTCTAQPAQIRTCGIPAYGSYLGYETANRLLGQGWRIRGLAKKIFFLSPTPVARGDTFFRPYPKSDIL